MSREAAAAMEAIPSLRNRGASAAWSDEQLLRQFLALTDESAEAAFATIIERHGAIVHRVCLDVLRDREEALDAAQAVFLVLARKAGSIRKPEALGPWLHGVALRVARRARSHEARRRTAERRKAEITDRRQSPDGRLDPLDYAELHEEVDRLPEKYRKPIILCYLQGRTQAEAAEELAWPLGTVQVRLHRGRERLRSRLTRRGAGAIALAGPGLGTSLSATAGLPGRGWTDATAAAAVRFASGQETAGLVAPVVTSLAESALAAMLFGSLKVFALFALAVLLSSGALALAGASRRAVTVTGAPARPKSAIAGPVRPRSTPNLSQREAPTVAVAATDRVTAARDVERLETPPASRAPLLDPLDDDDGGAAERQRPAQGRPPDSRPLHRPAPRRLNSGLELFERVWVKDDPRGHGGDGLGPVFNATSCVACHHLGGSGGAGGVERNIEIATVAEAGGGGPGYFYSFSMNFGTGRFDYRIGNPAGSSSRSAVRVSPSTLSGIHPGFREAQSVVLHHYGTDPVYNAWRATVPGQHGTLFVRTSERNPPPLFGAGLIDTIPDEAIEAAAKRKFPGSPAVKGRVSRVKDGRVGRFGWKGQTATLKEFVLSAAAGEMGLQVPGQHQAADPRLPGIGTSGLDMDEAECEALAAYVRSLPAPVSLKPADDQESAQLKSGEETFRTTGCVHCHVPKLGGVDGIYSDLLLHDMSPRLEDASSYAVFAGEPAAANGNAHDRNGTGTASTQEWRTPPLWGLRDSGPYLHDGRAGTIDEAIASHAGQGASSARRYAELSPRRKRHLGAFLRSLAAPPANP